MIITRQRLAEIIDEELEAVLSESSDYSESLQEDDNSVVADIAKKVGMALYRELVSQFSPEHLQPGTLQTMRSKLEQVVRHMVSELV